MLNFNHDEIIPHLPSRILKSKFFYLLCSLALYFLGTALLFGNIITSLINSLFLTAILLLCIFPFIKSKKLLLLVLSLGAGILITHLTVVFYDRSDWLFVLLYSLCICFLAVVTASVVYSVTLHKEITIDTLFGAVCGYLLIGFIWTFAYLLINTLDPHAFPEKMLDGSVHERTQHFFYFSFTTLTTLGYGDILPLSNMARTFSWLEAVVGQIYLAVWISQLVGLRITQIMSRSAIITKHTESQENKKESKTQ